MELRPGPLEYGAPILPNYNFVEYAVYVGALPLLLAGIGLLARPRGPALVALTAIGVLWLLAIGPRSLAFLYELPGYRACRRCGSPGRSPRLSPGSPPSALMLPGMDTAASAGGSPQPPPAAIATAQWSVRRWLSGQTPEDLLARLADPLLEHYRAMQANLDRATVASILEPHLPAAKALLSAQSTSGVWSFALVAIFATAVASLRQRPTARRVCVALALVVSILHQTSLAREVAGGRLLKHGLDTEIHEFLRDRLAEAQDDGGIAVARAAHQPDLPTSLPPMTLLPDRIRDLNAYTFVDGESHKAFLHGWGPAQMVREYWIAALPDRGPTPPLDSPYLDLLGIRYLLSTAPLEGVGEAIGPAWRGERAGAAFYIYERSGALPRAFVVPELVPCADQKELLTALLDENLAPRAAAYIDRSAATETPRQPNPAASERSVVFDIDEPTRLRMTVSDGPAGYLVVSDTPMSGWTASVNGAPAAIRRCNLAMRVITIPAGAAVVEMSYRTPGLIGGALLSALAILLLLALWFLGRADKERVSAVDAEL